MWKRILKYYPKPILFYRLTNMRSKDNISLSQYKLRYDISVAMQDNAAQHWWYSTGGKHNLKYW